MDILLDIIQKLVTNSPGISVLGLCFLLLLFKEQIVNFYNTHKHKLFRTKEPSAQETLQEIVQPLQSGLNVVIPEKRTQVNSIHKFLKQTFVYYFDETIHITDLEVGIKDLEKIINNHRAKQQKVVFDLTKTLILIEHAQEVFSTVFKRVIMNNNINFLVLLPNLEGSEDKYKNMTDLIELLVEYNSKHTTEATKIKVEV